MSLIYLYGIIPTWEEHDFTEFKGIDGEHEVYLLEYGSVTAVVCSLDESEYGEDVLNEKTNQIEWVKDKAYHHHQTLIKMREKTTILPMKFCTIYSSKGSLETMIHSHRENLQGLLHQLADKEEWNVKVYCDRNQLRKKVEEGNPEVQKKQEEIAHMSKGRQYLENKKLTQLIQKEVEQEQERFSEEIHNQLKEYAKQHVVKKNWNKDVTGKNVEMCWNSAYLLVVDQVEGFLEKIEETNDTKRDSGWVFEVTGPWPAYHFVNLS